MAAATSSSKRTVSANGDVLFPCGDVDYYSMPRNQRGQAVFQKSASVTSKTLPNYTCVRATDKRKVQSLSALDALSIAEVSLPRGGLRGLEPARRGTAPNGDDLPHLHIITTPNMTWIPDISKNPYDVQLHEDGKFGYHDFTLWPQWYFPETRHFAFVMRRPADCNPASSPFTVLWHSLDQKQDLVLEQGSLIPNFGRLSPSLLERIMEVRRCLTADIQKLLPTFAPSTHVYEKFLLENGIRAMQLTSVCLSVGAQSYPAVLATFTLFQRQALEMLALWEMLTEWDIRAKTAQDTLCVSATDRFIMGTITHSPHIAIEMASLGVPVWLVRPPHLVPRDIKIFEDAWPQGLEKQASLKVMQGIKSLYHVGSSSVSKNCTCLALPLGQLNLGGRPGIDDSDHLAGAAQVLSLARSPVLITYDVPMNNIIKEKFLINPKKYDTPNISIWPELLLVWRQALKDTPQDLSLIQIHADSKLLRGYALMDPFILAHTDRRGDLCLVVWLWIRNAWIAQVTTSWTPGSRFPSPQEWRDLVTYIGQRMDFDWSDGPVPSGSNLPTPASLQQTGQQSTKKVKARAKKGYYGVEMDADFANLFPLEIPQSLGPQQVYWRGQPILAPTQLALRPLPIRDQVRREVIWDLCEQNFRIEFLALDRILAPRNKMQQSVALARDAFIRNVYPSKSPVSTSLSEESLGARSTAFRAVFVNNFGQVILSWGAIGSPLMQLGLKLTANSPDTDIHKVEVSAYKIYCATFFRHFGRPPTVPHIFPRE